MSTSNFLTLTEIEIAWLSGLFEGEAYFGIDKRSIIRYKVSQFCYYPYIRISMTDEDIIIRVSKLLNKTYFSPKRLTNNNKRVFICHIGDRATLIYLFPLILPYMGIRRGEKIKECLVYLKKWQEK